VGTVRAAAMPIKRRPPAPLTAKEIPQMRLRNMLVRIAVPTALLAASVCAGWKWDAFPH